MAQPSAQSSAPPAVAPQRPAAPETLGALLDSILSATATAGPAAARPDNTPLEARVLRAWLAADRDGRPDRKGRFVRWLNRQVAAIDDRLNRQVNAILHHPTFQKLEAAWRGLHYLFGQVSQAEGVKLWLLNVSMAELKKDLLHALEFDCSQVFRKVYSEHFDMPGGEPIGLLVGDYAFTNHPEDVETLAKMSQVAAAAFAPFVAAADPDLLDLRSFGELEKPLNFAVPFRQPTYIKWQALRKSPDSRFVALALPRVLMRAPYRDDNYRTDGFRFQEMVGLPDRSDYLWGNPAYGFGGVVARAFGQSGWLADIRGARRGEPAGGVVTDLPDCSFTTDRRGLIPRAPTEVVITDALENVLSDLGLMPLCWCQDSDVAVFGTAQSIQLATAYNEPAASVNARISTMLQYILCASRFGHYLKVMARDLTGGYVLAEEFESYLSQWLLQYTLNNDSASDEMRARHPLRESAVRVTEVPGKPGRFHCSILLRPQFQLDQLSGSIRLEARHNSTTVR